VTASLLSKPSTATEDERVAAVLAARDPESAADSACPANRRILIDKHGERAHK
jgi:hypothetical protein